MEKTLYMKIDQSDETKTNTLPTCPPPSSKLVSELTACRKPLSNSLVAVESTISEDYFTNMVVWVTGPRRQWVVLGSFIPHPYSGTLNFSSFRVKRFC